MERRGFLRLIGLGSAGALTGAKVEIPKLDTQEFPPLEEITTVYPHAYTISWSGQIAGPFRWSEITEDEAWDDLCGEDEA